MKWLENLFKNKNRHRKSTKYQYLEERNPTQPVNFGIKTFWIAIKSNDHKEVCKEVNIDLSNECSWVQGTIKAFEGEVFITPPINGWVLLHSRSLLGYEMHKSPSLISELLKRLSKRFTECQYFANHSVVGFAVWTKFLNGVLKRHYLIVDGRGEIYGEPIGIESKWNLYNPTTTDHLTDEEFDAFVLPDYKEVLQVAEDWSVNPMKLETMEGIESTGYYGKIDVIY